MSVTSFMLSALSRMYEGAGLAAFTSAHPHCWLVWEPGVWELPTKDVQAGGAARSPTPSGDSLALALAARADRPPHLSLGRAPTCDIEVSDPTVSQRHLLFMQSAPARWTVRDAGSKNCSWVDGVQLVPGDPKALIDGMRIQITQVVLTYYEPQGLFARMQRRGAVGASTLPGAQLDSQHAAP